MLPRPCPGPLCPTAQGAPGDASVSGWAASLHTSQHSPEHGITAAFSCIKNTVYSKVTGEFSIS